MRYVKMRDSLQWCPEWQKEVRRVRGGEAGRRWGKGRKWWGCVRLKAAARRASHPTISVLFRAVRARPEVAALSEAMEGGLGCPAPKARSDALPWIAVMCCYPHIY